MALDSFSTIWMKQSFSNVLLVLFNRRIAGSLKHVQGIAKQVWSEHRNSNICSLRGCTCETGCWLRPLKVATEYRIVKTFLLLQCTMMLSRFSRDEGGHVRICEMTSASHCQSESTALITRRISPHKHDTFVRTTFGHQLTSASLRSSSNTV
jgi:hypothetical protein